MTEDELVQAVRRANPDGHRVDTSFHLMDQLRDLAQPYGFKPMLCGREDPGSDESIVFVTPSGYWSTISIDIPRFESGRIDAVVNVVDTVSTDLVDDWSHVVVTGHRRLNETPLRKTDEVMEHVKGIVTAQEGFGIDPTNLPAGARVLTNPRTLEVFQSVSILDARIVRVLGQPGQRERIDVDFGKEHGMLHVEITDQDATVRVRARTRKFSFDEFPDGTLGQEIAVALVEMNKATRPLRP